MRNNEPKLGTFERTNQESLNVTTKDQKQINNIKMDCLEKLICLLQQFLALLKYLPPLKVPCSVKIFASFKSSLLS